jgi:hypothetical protein
LLMVLPTCRHPVAVSSDNNVHFKELMETA